MDLDDLRPTHVEVQRIVESALQIFENSTLERCYAAILEAELVSLLETANQEPAKREKDPVYRVMEIVLRQADYLNTLTELIHKRLTTSPNHEASSNTSCLI